MEDFLDVSEVHLGARPDEPRAKPRQPPVYCLFGASTSLRERVWTRLTREFGAVEADPVGGRGNTGGLRKECAAAGRLFCLPEPDKDCEDAVSSPPQRVLAVWLRDASPAVEEQSLATRLGADVRVVRAVGGMELVYRAVRRALDSLACLQLPAPWVPPVAETSPHRPVAPPAKFLADAGAAELAHSPPRSAATMRDKLAERREARVRRRDRPVSGRGGPPRR